MKGYLSLEGPFWRRLARLGSTRGPEWFARVAPPLVGLVVCALAPDARRAIDRSLRRVRGHRGPLRNALDVSRTFATYASCLTDVLRSRSERARLPEAVIWGELHLQDALAEGRGVIFATAHTAGWETVGPLLSRDSGLRVMIVEQAEADATARAIQDHARTVHGLLVAHVSDDPLSVLPLLLHLREGGVLALQVDRVPRPLRSREVTLFGGTARMPEGPLQLARLTGAPILPVFAARAGYRRYEVFMKAPVRLPRTAGDAELDDAAQTLADAMQEFVQRRPTQWFHFRNE